MSEVNRRTIMKGAAATTAFAVTGGAQVKPAGAAAPKSDMQAPGFYRYRVGDIEVTVVTDGTRTFPLPDGFVANASKDDINAALEAAYMPRDQVTIYFSPIVVNTGSKLVVIDTGYGPATAEESNNTVGLFQKNLAAAGFSADAVDTVIISHFHGDHVNGLIDQNELLFPNAEILVPAKELAFWMDDGEMSRAPEGRMEGLFKNNRRIFNEETMKRVATYEWDKDVVSGITAQGTPGHTPGHTSFVISSGDDSVFVQSDVTNNPMLFVRNPGWHLAFDQDPAMAEETRRKVYDMAAAERMPVQGFHYPFPALGYISKRDDGYDLVPVPWTTQL